MQMDITMALIHSTVLLKIKTKSGKDLWKTVEGECIKNEAAPLKTAALKRLIRRQYYRIKTK